jgi:non-ribosomal peptide synthetase component F/thioesterase domain-containing protein
MTSQKARIETVHAMTGLQAGIFAECENAVNNAGRVKSGRVKAGRVLYCEQFSVVFDGLGNTADLVDAWQRLADRHAALRTAFVRSRDGVLRQVVLRRRALPVVVHPIGASSTDISNMDIATPFDLARDPLLRVHLVNMGPKVWRMIVSFHHLIADAWSGPILIDDLMSCFSGGRFDTRGTDSGTDSDTDNGAGDSAVSAHYCASTALPAHPGHLADLLAQHGGAPAHAYWRSQLSSAHVVALPWLRPATKKTKQKVQISVPVSDAARKALAQFCIRSKITESAVLHSIWGAFLARVTQRDAVVLATVLANRDHDLPLLDKSVGMFIATVPIVVAIGGAANLTTVARKVQEQLVAAPMWSADPLADMLGAADLRADQLDHVLVGRPDSLAWGNTETIYYPECGIRLRDYDARSDDHYGFQMGFVLGRTPSWEIGFDANRLAEAEAQSIAAMLKTLLDQALKAPDHPLEQVGFVAPDDASVVKNPRPAGSVSHWPVGLPDGVATSDESICVTYGELAHQVSVLANDLSDRGVVAGNLVAISAVPGVAFLRASLACWSIGAGFVPVDPNWPASRLADIFDQSCPAAAIGVDLRPGGAKLLADGLAYVIYTSGSTGWPKGVAVGRKAMDNYCATVVERLGFGPNDIGMQVASPSFDLGYTTAFGLLAAGGSIHWPSAQTLMDPQKVIAQMHSHGITVVKSTPSYLQLLLSAPDLSALSELRQWRLLILGGESPDPSQLRLLGKYCPWIKVSFHYGPTEATIGCAMTSAMPLDQALQKPDEIGAPVRGTTLTVLDKSGALQPRGIAGELTVTGAALACGYLSMSRDNPVELTKGFTATQSETSYRTGDQALITNDGRIKFMGRGDDLFKRRGHRISISDVQATLRQLSIVSDASVGVHRTPQEEELVAFVRARDPETTALMVRDALAKHLPAAQMPSRFELLSQFLLTPNGKTDVRSMLAALRPRVSKNGAAPANKSEIAMAAIWQDILGLDSISRDDDFFALGGHSLKALQISARHVQAGGKPIALRSFFDNPLLSELVAALSSSTHTTGALLNMRKGDEGRPILCFPASIGGAGIYRETMDILSPDTAVLGFDDLDDFDEARDIETMVSRMLDAAPRAAATASVLFGWSFGGALVWEAAAQIAQRFDHFPHLVLLDYVPGQGPAKPADDVTTLTDLAKQRYWSQLIGVVQRDGGPDMIARFERQLIGRQNKLRGFGSTSHMSNPMTFVLTNAKADSINRADRMLIPAWAQVIRTDGDHFSMFHPPHVGRWCAQLSRILQPKQKELEPANS